MADSSIRGSWPSQRGDDGRRDQGRWLVAGPGRRRTVAGLEIGSLDEQDGHADQVGHARPGGLQGGLEVGHHSLDLGHDVVAARVALCVDGVLAADVDLGGTRRTIATWLNAGLCTRSAGLRSSMEVMADTLDQPGQFLTALNIRSRDRRPPNAG